MASVRMEWLQWVGLWPQCVYLCLCGCSKASECVGCPKWVWDILSVWYGLSGVILPQRVRHGLSGCGIVLVGVTRPQLV